MSSEEPESGTASSDGDGESSGEDLPQTRDRRIRSKGSSTDSYGGSGKSDDDENDDFVDQPESQAALDAENVIDQIEGGVPFEGDQAAETNSADTERELESTEEPSELEGETRSSSDQADPESAVEGDIAERGASGPGVASFLWTVSQVVGATYAEVQNEAVETLIETIEQSQVFEFPSDSDSGGGQEPDFNPQTGMAISRSQRIFGSAAYLGGSEFQAASPTDGTSRDAIDQTAAEDAASTVRFAEETFAEGSITEDPLSGARVSRAREPSHSTRIGGFDEFDYDLVDEWVSVTHSDPEEGVGSTIGSIDRGEISDESTAGTHRVYRTKFGADGVDDEELKFREMAGYAFTEAVGVETPRKTYDPERNEVVSEDVGGPEYDTASVLDINPDQPFSSTDKLDADVFERVQRDEYVDKMAVQVLAGNDDLSSDNIMIGEDGTVHTFDYDHSGKAIESEGDLHDASIAAARTAEKIDQFRSEENQLEISAADIAERAAEVAYELDESGHDQFVIGAVEAQAGMIDQDQTAATLNDDQNRSNGFDPTVYGRNLSVAADIAREYFRNY